MIDVVAHVVGGAVLFVGWTAITMMLVKRAYRMGKVHEFQRIARVLGEHEAREKEIAPILLEDEVLAPSPWDDAIEAIVVEEKDQ